MDAKPVESASIGEGEKGVPLVVETTGQVGSVEKDKATYSESLRAVFEKLQHNPLVTKESIKLRSEFEAKANAVVAKLKKEFPEVNMAVGLAGSVAVGMAREDSDFDPVVWLEAPNGESVRSEKYERLRERIQQLGQDLNKIIPVNDINEMKQMYGPGSHVMDTSRTRWGDSDDPNYRYWWKGEEKDKDVSFLIEQRKTSYPELFRLVSLFAPTTEAQEGSGVPDRMRRELIEVIAQRPDSDLLWAFVQGSWNLQYVRPEVRESIDDIGGKGYGERVRNVIRDKLNERLEKRGKTFKVSDERVDKVKGRIEEARAAIRPPDLDVMCREYGVTERFA